ncbi:redoxin family protein [Chitinophaga horti]|uniref:Redoxin family protein n=1 Tax=Chitinophaga horti TaxID=2920382 RepID=A0ABY6J489_9BACT|nr:redoxin family protein [Chitinophaga horti]UYQ94408.1 redoxin family protein [Chitinophaga horti]
MKIINKRETDMKCKIFIGLTILTLFGLQVLGQSAQLKLGDIVPDLVLNHRLTDKTVEKLSQTRGKILLIDFWATWCSPCIDAMPKMIKLVEVHSNDLDVIMVTNQSPEVVEAFRKRRPDLDFSKVQLVAGDSVLNRWFPSHGIPHVAWIGRDGKLLATTGSDQVMSPFVEDAIAGRRLTLKQTRYRADYNVHFPLPIDTGDVKVRSTLLKGFYGRPSTGYSFPISLAFDLYTPVQRIAAINFPVVPLFIIAANGWRVVPTNLNWAVLEMKNKASYVDEMKAGADMKTGGQVALSTSLVERYENRIFGYELVLPEQVSQEVGYGYMLQDLNRAFNVYGVVEKRSVPAFVIKVIKPEKIKKGQGEGNQPEFLNAKKAGNFGTIRNVKMDYLVAFLNRFNTEKPLVDQTGINQALSIELEISTDRFSIAELKKALELQGMTIEEKEAVIPIVVIRDKEGRTGVGN